MTIGQWHGGKGSVARYGSKSKFDQEFDRIFNKKNSILNEGDSKDGSQNEDSGEATTGSDDSTSKVRPT